MRRLIVQLVLIALGYMIYRDAGEGIRGSLESAYWLSRLKLVEAASE